MQFINRQQWSRMRRKQRMQYRQAGKGGQHQSQPDVVLISLGCRGQSGGRRSDDRHQQDDAGLEI